MVRKPSGQPKNCPDKIETVQKIQKSIRIVQKVSRQFKKYPDSSKNIQTVQKVSGQFKKYPDSSKTIQKLSVQYLYCPDNPETFRAIQKVSGLFRNYWDIIWTVRTIQKLSGQNMNCPDNPETFRTIQKILIWSGLLLHSEAVQDLLSDLFASTFACKAVSSTPYT